MKQLRLSSNAITHPGHVRPKNEDSYLLQGEVGIWMVADGMGGHAQGDYASARVTEPISVAQPFTSLEEGVRCVRQAIHERHQNLLDYASQQGLKTVCGCTVVSLVVFGDQACLLWAGDSRGYHFVRSNQQLQQKTIDHTYIAELVNNGGLSMKQAHQHPYAGMITRAVGMANAFEIDEVYLDLSAGERFLLCSDGLYNELSEFEIRDCLHQGERPGETCRALLTQVLAKPARDNVTILIVDIGDG